MLKRTALSVLAGFFLVMTVISVISWFHDEPRQIVSGGTPVGNDLSTNFPPVQMVEVPDFGQRLVGIPTDVLASTISILGTVITVFFLYRTDRREKRKVDAELEKLRLEIERLEAEIGE